MKEKKEANDINNKTYCWGFFCGVVGGYFFEGQRKNESDLPSSI